MILKSRSCNFYSMDIRQTDNSVSTILGHLIRDFTFLVALIVAPLFWLGLYYSGTEISGPAWLSTNVWLFFQLALLYPVMEELVFRGWLQERLWKTRLSRLSIYCISMPNIVTSVVFTGFHFLIHPPVSAVAVIVPSLVFGFFRDRYQSVFPSIILHVFYNTGIFLLFGR